MTSKFEDMGHKLGDKFLVVKDYYDFGAGDIVTAVRLSQHNDNMVFCEGKKALGVPHWFIFAGENIEIILYKEGSTVVSKTNTLNVGEVGSPRYEVIRKVLAVLDGDEVRVDKSHRYNQGSRIQTVVEELKEAIFQQTQYPNDYQLKSEQLPVLSEKDLKIKELEDNIEVMKKNLEELKGM